MYAHNCNYCSECIKIIKNCIYNNLEPLNYYCLIIFTANSDDSAEQNEIAEDHSADSSVNSSQGGCKITVIMWLIICDMHVFLVDYVYEVNPSADSNDEENASNDEDSPTSSQSGGNSVLMQSNLHFYCMFRFKRLSCVACFVY